MVQLTYPGVYVQEVPSGARTITGVATSIAAFVGMAKNGPINEPTLVLGFRDYVRTFSEDTSQGEMTDQVRQFFLNGGAQAYIVRIAKDSAASTVEIPTGIGGVTLNLTAKSDGTLGDALRATVDYNTANPESTFNLTIFRERTDASGNITIAESETHSNLTMDPASPRYVKLVVQNNSGLVNADVVGSVTRNDSFSISSVTAPTEPLLNTLVSNAFPDTPGEVKKLQVRVGTASAVVAINRGDLTAGSEITSLAAFLNQALGLPASSLTATALSIGTVASPAFVLNFTATVSGQDADVVFDRAPDSDAAVGLGLGVNQGGVEQGVYSTARPLPNGFVSTLSNAAPLDRLIALAATTKEKWIGPTGGVALRLLGASPITVLANEVVFPGDPDTGILLLPAAAGTPSLAALAANIDAIVAAINAKPSAWRAVRLGYRIALQRTSGAAASGADHTWSTPDAALVAFHDMFPAESESAGRLFAAGDDGDKPELADYRNAFTALDQKTDVFNILMLPRSKDDLSDTGDRFAFWGEASAFAQARRAFLLIDAQNNVKTVIQARDAVVQLRVGLVKDHAAFYWPRVRIDPDNNPRFIDASGTIAGIMSRIDSSRGVWKAPAGIEADLRAVLAVETPMSDPENGLLNPRAVNVVRSFTNGIVSWGARTMDGFDNSGNDDYKYVPVRRFALFMEESLVRGLKFAVFEPNDEPLWAQIRLAVGSFLNGLFRRGAFAGKSSRDAYFVKVDSETTTQNDINLGIVNVIVGFAPLKPAEFVVITLQQKAGQVQV